MNVVGAKVAVGPVGDTKAESVRDPVKMLELVTIIVELTDLPG